MRGIKVRVLFLVLVLFMGCAGSNAAAADVLWNHDPISEIGPYHWGELDRSFEACSDGQEQSPVDIVRRIWGPKHLKGPLTFSYKDSPLVVENNGHAIEVPYEPGSWVAVGKEPYELKQFHFHAPSEHTLDGAFYTMEAHFVHSNKAGQLAVVGVWMKACQELDPRCTPNEAVDRIFENAPMEEGTTVVQNAHVNARDLLPLAGKGTGHFPAWNSIRDYYTYPGSLTTPPCTEGVRWFVVKEPVVVSQATVDKLHEIIREFPAYKPPINGRSFDDNNRPTQPLNGRRILEPR